MFMCQYIQYPVFPKILADLGFGFFFLANDGPLTGGITYKDVANYLFKNKVRQSMAAARQPRWSSVIYWGSSNRSTTSRCHVLTVAFEHYWKNLGK